MFSFAKADVEKKKIKVFKTNCYICSCHLDAETAKASPNDGDKRFFCVPHWTKLFGKKRKLIKRL